MAEERNVCAGPFGAVYDFYIEGPLLARLVLGAMWGVDPRPFYRSLAAVSALPDGATVLDVPCGGGAAAGLLNDLRDGQHLLGSGACVLAHSRDAPLDRRSERARVAASQ
jgi:hypothetical protein